MGYHLEPEPGGISAVPGTGIDSRSQFIFQDVVDSFHRASFASLPLQYFLTVHVPDIAHHRVVPDTAAIAEKFFLPGPYPDGQVAVRLVVLFLFFLAFDENPRKL